MKQASVAQLVEHRFRKPEVKGSSPFAGSIESVSCMTLKYGWLLAWLLKRQRESGNSQKLWMT